MSHHIVEFLQLVQQGLFDNPDMPVDVAVLAANGGVDTRTAYRRLKIYRGLCRTLAADGLKVSVRKTKCTT